MALVRKEKNKNVNLRLSTFLYKDIMRSSKEIGLRGATMIMLLLQDCMKYSRHLDLEIPEGLTANQTVRKARRARG